MSKTGEPGSSEPQPQMVQAIIAEIKEQEAQDWIKKEIRVGGLPDDWQMQEVLEEKEIEEGRYVSEPEILERKIKKAIPSVDIVEPSLVTIKGQQIVLRYLYLKEKITVMKQTRSLKGTKVWMADELTPLQLKIEERRACKST